MNRQSGPTTAPNRAVPAPVRDTPLDRSGQRWEYVGEPSRSAEITDFAAAVAPSRPPLQSPFASYDDLSDDELAERIRPIQLVGNTVYRLATPPVQLVKDVRAAVRRGADLLPPGKPTRSPPEPSSSDPVASVVVGTDTRYAATQYSSVYYPLSTMVAFAADISPASNGNGACTATMIGTRTAVTAAHCFYNYGVGWYPTRQWAAGVSTFYSGGSLVQNVASGNFTGCYTVTIPTAWTLYGDYLDDYATIEFAAACDLTPYTGWLGLRFFYDYEMTSAALVHLDGYPAPSPNYSYPFPSLYVTSGSGAANVFPWQNSGNPSPEIYHTFDTSGGNSGSALRFPYPGQTDPLYVGAIHKGALAGSNTANIARRTDSGVIAFVFAASSSI